MKKQFLFLFLIPLMALFSCNDDNDLAEVDITLEISGVSEANGEMYTVEGTTVAVEKLEVTSLTDKNATIQRVEYFIDGLPLPINLENFFTTSFSTEGFRIGKHSFGLTGVVLQVDKTLTNIKASLPLNIVESEEDLPDGASELGTATITVSTKQTN